MIHATTTVIPFPFPIEGAPGSLCWEGDTLVNWSMGYRYHLDGRSEQIGYYYDDQFNGAASHPDGRYTCIYQKHGTKALLLDQGVLIREIDRSYYLARTHEFPMALFRLPDGRDVLAHCPQRYGRIEIDEILTGERLTALAEREGSQIFHSRLATNGAGTLLLSAGWVWHPIEIISIYDITQGLDSPATLDDFRGIAPRTLVEIGSAAFFGDSSVMFCTTKEVYDDEDEEEVLGPLMLAHYDLKQQAYIRTVTVGEMVGTIFPLSERYVVGLYDHPKVFDLFTGQIVHRLPELPTGKQEDVLSGARTVPPMAFDPARQRIAVRTETGIVVVQYRIE